MPSVICFFCRDSIEDGHDPKHCQELIQEAEELEGTPYNNPAQPPAWYHEVIAQELT